MQVRKQYWGRDCERSICAGCKVLRSPHSGPRGEHVSRVPASFAAEQLRGAFSTDQGSSVRDGDALPSPAVLGM